MNTGQQSDATGGRGRTTVERTSERDLVVTRTVDGPARLVFEAWADAEMFRRWWAPQSFGVSVLSYDADVRAGGGYRLVMDHPSFDKPMAFFGRYIDVTPQSRLIWTNDEGGEEGSITTVTFAETEGATRVVVHERYPSKDVLDEAMASGSTSGWGEQFEQLNDLIRTLHAAA